MSRSETLRDNQRNACSRRRGSPSRCTHKYQGNPDITNEKLLNTHCSSRYKGELHSFYHNTTSLFFYNLRKTAVQLLWIKSQFSLYVKGFTFDFPLEPPKLSADLFYRGCHPAPLCTVQCLTKTSYFLERTINKLPIFSHIHKATRR